MSAETKDLTPREVRLCREAWIEGRAYDTNPLIGRHDPTCVECIKSRELFAREAADRYPMPTVEVPRVSEIVKNGRRHRFRVVDGRIETLHDGIARWETFETQDVAFVLADLIARPTERIPADEAESRGAL